MQRRHRTEQVVDKDCLLKRWLVFSQTLAYTSVQFESNRSGRKEQQLWVELLEFEMGIGFRFTCSLHLLLRVESIDLNTHKMLCLFSSHPLSDFVMLSADWKIKEESKTGSSGRRNIKIKQKLRTWSRRLFEISRNRPIASLLRGNFPVVSAAIANHLVPTRV